jgi:hypothetical protein
MKADVQELLDLLDAHPFKPFVIFDANRHFEVDDLYCFALVDGWPEVTVLGQPYLIDPMTMIVFEG